MHTKSVGVFRVLFASTLVFLLGAVGCGGADAPSDEDPSGPEQDTRDVTAEPDVVGGATDASDTLDDASKPDTDDTRQTSDAGDTADGLEGSDAIGDTTPDTDESDGHDTEPDTSDATEPGDTTDATDTTETDTNPDPCKPTDQSTVAGFVFDDLQAQADSAYAYPAMSAVSALEDVPVKIRGSGGFSAETQTCWDGWFKFDSTSPGKYLVSVNEQNQQFCTTTNDAEHLPAAVDSGEVNLVAFGDSLPTQGVEPYFPTLLDRHIEDLGPNVELKNVAVGGSTSDEWLPSKEHYTDKLKPHLSDADVVVFSIGGNDLYSIRKQLDTPLSLADAQQAIQMFNQTKTEIISNIETITAQLRQDAPNADIVWVLYPNYARSDQWQSFLGSAQSAATTFLKGALEDIRKKLSDEKRLMIADMLEATSSLDLTAHLDDPLHLNKQGHEVFAREIFFLLGGVIKGSNQTEIGIRRRVGFNNNP